MTTEPQVQKPGRKTSIAGGLLFGAVLILQLSVIFMKDPEPEFDPNQIDLKPAIAQLMQQQNEHRVNDAMQVIRIAEEHGRVLRNRWFAAQQQGLVGDTGVLYVPAERRYQYDGKRNTFGPAQTSPPQSGYYVIITRELRPDGRIAAKIVGAHAIDGPPAIPAAKPTR